MLSVSDVKSVGPKQREDGGQEQERVAERGNDASYARVMSHSRDGDFLTFDKTFFFFYAFRLRKYGKYMQGCNFQYDRGVSSTIQLGLALLTWHIHHQLILQGLFMLQV